MCRYFVYLSFPITFPTYLLPIAFTYPILNLYYYLESPIFPLLHFPYTSPTLSLYFHFISPLPPLFSSPKHLKFSTSFMIKEKPIFKLEKKSQQKSVAIWERFDNFVSSPPFHGFLLYSSYVYMIDTRYVYQLKLQISIFKLKLQILQ